MRMAYVLHSPGVKVWLLLVSGEYEMLNMDPAHPISCPERTTRLTMMSACSETLYKIGEELLYNPKKIF